MSELTLQTISLCLQTHILKLYFIFKIVGWGGDVHSLQKFCRISEYKMKIYCKRRQTLTWIVENKFVAFLYIKIAS